MCSRAEIMGTFTPESLDLPDSPVLPERDSVSFYMLTDILLIAPPLFFSNAFFLLGAFRTLTWERVGWDGRFWAFLIWSYNLYLTNTVFFYFFGGAYCKTSIFIQNCIKNNLNETY